MSIDDIKATMSGWWADEEPDDLGGVLAKAEAAIIVAVEALDSIGDPKPGSIPRGLKARRALASIRKMLGVGDTT